MEQAWTNWPSGPALTKSLAGRQLINCLCGAIAAWASKARPKGLALPAAMVLGLSLIQLPLDLLDKIIIRAGLDKVAIGLPLIKRPSVVRQRRKTAVVVKKLQHHFAVFARTHKDEDTCVGVETHAAPRRKKAHRHGQQARTFFLP